MRYVLVQGKVDSDDHLHPALKKQFNKYETALKEFELIKDEHSGYKLDKDECVMTLLLLLYGDKVLNLYKCHPVIKIFKL